MVSYAEVMAKVTMDKAALRRLEKQVAEQVQPRIDAAIDATAARSAGKSPTEVDAILRTELERQGVEPGDDTAVVAAQIVAAIDPAT